MTNVLQSRDNREKEADDSLWQGLQDLWDRIQSPTYTEMMGQQHRRRATEIKTLSQHILQLFNWILQRPTREKVNNMLFHYFPNADVILHA